MTNLKNSVVLVVGASGGLGERISSELRKHGAIVVGTSRKAHDDYLEAELHDDSMPARIVGEILDRYGRLDGLVIAAGVVAFGPVTEVSDATLHRLFAVNSIGPMRLIRQASEALTQSSNGGGHPFVLTLTGVVSESPTADLAAYSASKSALAAFVTAARREFRRAGIRMLDARPGHTETALSSHPIAGIPPKFPPGLSPDFVAERIVRAIVDDEPDLPSTAFAR